MPQYEFECEECQGRYEKQLTIKDFEEGLHCCPKCGGKGNKVLYAPAVHMRLSLMHPRHMRGQRGEFIKQKGNVLK